MRWGAEFERWRPLFLLERVTGAGSKFACAGAPAIIATAGPDIWGCLAGPEPPRRWPCLLIIPFAKPLRQARRSVAHPTCFANPQTYFFLHFPCETHLVQRGRDVRTAPVDTQTARRRGYSGHARTGVRSGVDSGTPMTMARYAQAIARAADRDPRRRLSSFLQFHFSSRESALTRARMPACAPWNRSQMRGMLCRRASCWRRPANSSERHSMSSER